MSFESLTVREFLTQTSAKTPTPGGGAVASVTGALGAALGTMVVMYSVGKKSLAAHDALHAEALAELTRLTDRSLELAARDAQAYARLNTLWKLDESDPVRVRDYASAVEAAIDAPHAMLHAAMELLRLLQRLAGATNAMLKSDLAIAAVLAEGAARSAAWNVRINLPQLDDEPMRAQFEKTIQRSIAQAREICSAVELACA